ncbi:MAG: hypothetical protein HY928_05160 [Elusimicrobia bacterium]|nr:hypothetical protein [Elusimicrobiota bacterium]
MVGPLDANRPGRGTVTDFHEFVWAKFDENTAYRRYPELRRKEVVAHPRPEQRKQMALGKIGHREVEAYRKRLAEINRAIGKLSYWDLVFSDPHDDTGGQVFESPQISVDGKPMRGKPDVVFKSTSTGLVLIIERKVTRVPLDAIPETAYPNVRIQLWSYGWMSPWNSLPDGLVELRAEFYSPDLQTRRDSRVWTRKEIHAEALMYLEEYGGAFSDEAR